MQVISLDEVATILETAHIEQTIELGHVIAHAGTTEAGHRFVLINDFHGLSTVSYSH